MFEIKEVRKVESTSKLAAAFACLGISTLSTTALFCMIPMAIAC